MDSGEALRDAADGDGDFRLAAERGEQPGIAVAKRVQAVPEHERDIVVRGVFRVLEERAREVGAGCRWEALERGG